MANERCAALAVEIDEQNAEQNKIIKSKIEVSTGCPKKNAILTLEANISVLKAPIGESRTSFENYMFSVFI